MVWINVVIFALFLGTAKAEPLKVHPKVPYECTFHFIPLSTNEILVLDVIRSKEFGNSIRFLHILNGKISKSYIRQEEGFQLSNKGNRIFGSSKNGRLKFDFNFNIELKGPRVPPVSDWGFDISLRDYLKVNYEKGGWLEFDGEKRRIDKSVQGSLSHHFGLRLPPYVYFNTLGYNGVHVVGALSVIPNKLGFKLSGGYINVLTPKKIIKLSSLNSKIKLTFNSNEDRVIKFLKVGSKRRSLEVIFPGVILRGIPHILDGMPTKIISGVNLKIEKFNINEPVLIDWRNFENLRWD